MNPAEFGDQERLNSGFEKIGSGEMLIGQQGNKSEMLSNRRRADLENIFTLLGA